MRKHTESSAFALLLLSCLCAERIPVMAMLVTAAAALTGIKRAALRVD